MPEQTVVEFFIGEPSSTATRRMIPDTHTFVPINIPYFGMPGIWREERRSPNMGIEEMRWLTTHKQELVNYQRLWIAVLGQGIVASGASFDEVCDLLNNRGVQNALVTYVSDLDEAVIA